MYEKPKPVLRVAVIGAGASGLAAIKCCLDESLVPTCFEKSDGIGGLWRFDEKPTPGRAGVYRSTTINTSKELLAYSTFPPPADFPNFMHHSKLYQYMKLYAEEYGLKRCIQFNIEVISVEKTVNFDKNDQWNVTTKTWNSKEQREIERTEVFDAVMVCTGHHAYPNNPAENIHGYETFQGRVTHGHDYRDHKPFENRRVMVVGLGNTGGDLAAELSRHSTKTYLSTRRGAWVINRIAHRGLPYDCEVVTRLFKYLMNITPSSTLNWFYEKKMTDRFDHELYGLKPKHRIMSQHPLVNDELPARIANGTVTVVPDVSHFKHNGIVTSDGILQEVDDVIFATGYIIKFPFLSNDVITVEDNNNLSPLYKHVFPIPDTEHPTIALIGNVQPVGGLMPIAEMQSRWATRVFKGICKLPSKAEMQKEIDDKKRSLQRRYVNSKRHTIQVDYMDYIDEIASEIGASPNIAKLFISDPILAWHVLNGPASAYQFRLQGPGTWNGARHAIVTQWQRIHEGYGRKVPAKPNSQSQFCKDFKPTRDRTLLVDKSPSEGQISFKKSINTASIFDLIFIIIMLMSATLIFAFPL
ncbi:flavin-containing monooxygenase 5-like [Styela clava]